MTTAPIHLGADAGSRAAAAGPESTDAPDTSTRQDRMRPVYKAAWALERRGADLRPTLLEVVADLVLDGAAAVPFTVIRRDVSYELGRTVSTRRLDRAIDRLVADGLLRIVREADPEAHRCRVFALGPNLVGGGAR